MKKALLLSFLGLACVSSWAQQATNLPPFTIQPWEKTAGVDGSSATTQLISRSNAAELGVAGFDPALKPFYHGVASGDPLADGVIIWTRVTPETDAPITVSWQLASDPAMTDIVQTGTVTTDSTRDYTVKIDVDNLQAATTYYYQFSTDEASSLVGRTRTARTSATPTDRLRLAVVSCSHYAQGYFNAYGRIADRADLEAVVHLGDYIYEYGNSGGFVGTARAVEPDYEIVSLADYRTRHSLYKLDHDLMRMEQQHPLICVWDDHEIANDAWQNGAQNHDDATEGSYNTRKAVGEQAYFEWMPIRDPAAGQPYRVERTIHYGDLLDLIMIDTRHEGREQQVAISDPLTTDPDRTLLGNTQAAWLANELANSTARWKVMGNQVVFTPINTLNVLGNEDMWDGYPAERLKIKNLIDSLSIKNFVVLTGDIHIGIAADITLQPTNGYDPATGATAFGVEFVTSSVTSSNDEALTDLPFTLDQLYTVALSLNPQAKYLNLIDHGYFVLDVSPTQAQADWYVIDTKLTPSTNESANESLYTLDQVSHLQQAAAPMPSLPNPPLPAPNYTGIAQPNQLPNSSVALLAVYPNPAQQIVHVHYALAKAMPLSVQLLSANGTVVANLREKITQTAGVYDLRFDATALPNGTYVCQISTPEGNINRTIVVAR